MAGVISFPGTPEPRRVLGGRAYQQPGSENNREQLPPFAERLLSEAGGAQQQESPLPDLEKETREEVNRYLTETTPFPAPMREEAFHGLVGQIARIMAAHCEASPETLLVQCLVMIGSIVGRSAYVYAGGPIYSLTNTPFV